jgi:hypothetical protein
MHAREWNRSGFGYFALGEGPRLGLELDDTVVSAHPYQPQPPMSGEIGFPAVNRIRMVGKLLRVSGISDRGREYELNVDSAERNRLDRLINLQEEKCSARTNLGSMCSY